MARYRTMHRDQIGHGAEMTRGLRSKQYVAELRERGVTRDEAIEAIIEMYGVPRAAAGLYVASHPAWAEDGPRSIHLWWAARG
jgi:hypothetical protein